MNNKHNKDRKTMSEKKVPVQVYFPPTVHKWLKIERTMTGKTLDEIIAGIVGKHYEKNPVDISVLNKAS